MPPKDEAARVPLRRYASTTSQTRYPPGGSARCRAARRSCTGRGRDPDRARPATRPPAARLRRDELRDDIANADRYAAEHADRLRHVAAFTPAWRVWDGARWAPDETGEHIEGAKRTADRLLSPRRRRRGDKWPKHAAATRRAGRLRAMVNLAASDPRLARRARDFDCDPWLLNTPSRHARPPHTRAPVRTTRPTG